MVGHDRSGSSCAKVCEAVNQEANEFFVINS